LVGWCRFYDGITSSFDVPPPDDVYEVDYKLDAWVKGKKAEREKKLSGDSPSSNHPRDLPRRPNSLVDSYDSSVIKQ
jgi:hypothetical protein